jgi:maleate cis-trans isomerase
MAAPPEGRPAYGWRARIAMIKPSPVTDTNIHEFYLMAPPGVELFLASMNLGGMRQEEYDKAIANLDGPIKLLAHHDPQAIIQPGVPPIVTRGWGFEDELRARVASITPAPFFSDVGAAIAGLKALGSSRIVVLSYSFDDELMGTIARYMANAAIEVVGWDRVRPAWPGDVAAAPLEVIYQAARALFERHAGQADGLWITHASMPSVGVLAELERDLRVPVLSSAQALMWAGLRAAGVAEPVEGFGRLLTLPFTR